MLQLIVYIASVILAISMFKVKIEYKIGYLLLMYQLFSFVKFPVLGRVNFLIPLCFIISEFRNAGHIMNYCRKTIVSKSMTIFILAMILLVWFSPHLHGLDSIRFLIQEEILFKYFLLIYAFFACRNPEQFKTIIKISFIGLTVMTIVGGINLITQSSFYIGNLMSGYDTSSMFDGHMNFSSMYANSSRFRVNSTFLNPFDYGFMSVALLLTYLYAHQVNLITKKTFYYSVIACAFGIFTCGCRTVIFCGIIAFIVFILTAYNTSKGIKYILVILILSIASYVTIPEVASKVDFALSALDNNSDVSGSSMEGRLLQYTTVFYHINDDLLFGRGYMYFTIDLGWGGCKASLVDQDLFGLEGVAMNYLLERGFVGYFLYLLFYVLIIFYLIRNRHLMRSECALGLSVITAYFVFSNMTGELYSVQPTMLVLGCALGIIINKKK